MSVVQFDQIIRNEVSNVALIPLTARLIAFYLKKRPTFGEGLIGVAYTDFTISNCGSNSFYAGIDSTSDVEMTCSTLMKI